MSIWNFEGNMVAPGEKKQTILKINVYDDVTMSAYELPVTLINGVGEGKTVLITACIHSDEYPAIPASFQCAKEIDPMCVNGKIMIFHCVNTSGFWANSIAVVPEDGFNLNSDYPGSPIGGPGARIADWFVKKVFPDVDFILDMHSGSNYEKLSPCVFFPNAPKVREAAVEAAKAMEIECLIRSENRSGEIGYAAFMCDIPGLLAETGGVGLCEKEWVDAYRRNIYLLLNHLNVYDGGIVRREEFQGIIYSKAFYQKAEESGLWIPAVDNRDFVHKGELLGTVVDFFGNPQHAYYAQSDAIVFYHTGRLMVQKGNALIAYGSSEDMQGSASQHHHLTPAELHARLKTVEAQVRDIYELAEQNIFREELITALDTAKRELETCQQLIIKHHADHHLNHPEHEHRQE